MAFSTLANLISDTFIGLGSPPIDWISPEEVCREVLRATGLDTQILSQSSENQIISHCTFTPSQREFIVSNAINFGVPAWLERQVYSGQYAAWQYIAFVNLAVVDDCYMRGDATKAAIYGENSSLKIRLSYNPQTMPYRQHRLWFDPNPLLAQTLTSTAVGTLYNGIPEAYSPMVSGQAIMALIPLMETKAAMSENKPGETLVNAWAKLLKSTEKSVAMWQDRYRHYVFGSKGGQRGRRRENIIARGGWNGAYPGFKS